MCRYPGLVKQPWTRNSLGHIAMSTIHAAPEPGPAATKRQVYSPLEKYWNTFLEWRQRERLRTKLCQLTETKPTDIGIARGGPERETAMPRCSTGGRNGSALILMMLCSACLVAFASDARAQCTASDVLQNQLRRNKSPSPIRPLVQIRSAVDVPVWKKITVGSFSDLLALRNALNKVGCGIGDSAEEVLARPAFTLSATKADVELLAVSAAELGFQTETASLGQIYGRAKQLGFELAAAEIAPQLRLQYFDQPVGEFLIIGMEPIKTWKGEPVILTVANGGAGLILIGQDGRADAEISVTSRFLFVQSNKTAPAEAALFHR
jgi:uncharacterized protein YjiS (DUF1127 family)